MADQQLDAFDGEAEEERLWEALSSFKKVVHDLVEMTGLSTNVLADTYGFGKGKVATWQNAKREGPNIPPLRFVEVLIKEAQERANLQDGAAAVFLAQYGELLELYCSRAKPHNVHHRMLADFQNTLLIRKLNNATNAALEQIAALTEELETLRDDRDGERERRIALQRQIDSLGSQNQNRAAEKRTALAKRDQVRAALAPYEHDQLPVPVGEQPGAEQGGSHENHPHEPVVVLPGPPTSDRGTKRWGLALALIAAGALVAVLAVVGLAVYAVIQLLPGDHSGPDDAAGTSPAPAPAASAGGSAGRPGDTTSAGTPATPPVAGGGSARGGSSSSGGGAGGSSGNGTPGGSSGSAPGDASGGNATGGKTTGGSGDGGGSGGSNASSGSGGASGATSPKPPPSSGHFQLRDVGYGKCLAVSFSGAVFATCADSPATNWTAKAGSGGSYKLYNESAGQCLTVYFNQMRLADCGSGADQSWRTGTSSTVVNLSSSMCLDESSGWPVLASCEPSKSTQHWARD
ncbi:ricin-type beta-trefoil lectin domain protein [Streptomyces sp. NPDC058316]|uniref:ricin-type beta-trefoil lectin domain protein n=1 Tax=Streptomyces sp. NPDC058316 TaxID=3346442 RepID=UPI0036E09BF8